MARPNPRTNQIRSVQLTDRQIRRAARLASQEAERIVRTAGSVRGAQAQLAALNVEMWAGVRDATAGGIEDAIVRSADMQGLFDNELFNKAGIPQSHWRESVKATAREGVNSYISRKQNGLTLSEKVWRNSQAARRGLEDAINTGLLLGKSPAEIAVDVRKYVSPDVPGGSSYAAMRLGRSEVLNAYHTSSINSYKSRPWVDAADWHLSGSHPRPDQCNEYEGGGDRPDGSWSLGQVPDKPHPNCLCYITPVMMDFEEYVRRFEGGEFDDYIDAQISHAELVA